ncbi:MAG: U32 family peptidase [Paludibacteraceae bacterium]|nr:U32 family peptidase [Paludibacteraceae bacterium]
MTVELLSPAKNADIGIEAILHGADAVYIGAAEFGARKAAGNSIENIKRLTDFAHIYKAKVYVTVNTIIKESEISSVEKLITELYNAGVDALIVQDFGILKMNIPPIALHASTQMHNTTPEKVKFLHDTGFSQVVLARECSIDDIRAIHAATPVKLEAFIHGALCVSYSGRCYASCALTGRSANRGECAQICRLPFQLQDKHGHNLGTAHYLSLKDMDHSDDIEDMILSGVSSFKIEGRLKDADYVKNITAYYRRKIDEVLGKHPEWHRSSDGVSNITFTPNKFKSFYRGGITYFYYGRAAEGGLDAKGSIYSPFTPKSIGEYIGTVSRAQGRQIEIRTEAELHNGDGLCFLSEGKEFLGFRINTAQNINTPKGAAVRCETSEAVAVKPGTEIYRNADIQFTSMLGKPTAVRKIGVAINLTDTTLSVSDGDITITENIDIEKQMAQKDQSENIKAQLSKLGDTPYSASSVEVSTPWFFPMSAVAQARRTAIQKLTEARQAQALNAKGKFTPSEKNARFPFTKADYTENIANSLSEQFYHEHGVNETSPAFELKEPSGVPVMYCKHCIRFMLGACKKEKSLLSRELSEPLYLIHKNYYLRLEFDCKNCMMLVYKG